MASKPKTAITYTADYVAYEVEPVSGARYDKDPRCPQCRGKIGVMVTRPWILWCRNRDCKHYVFAI